MYKRILFSLVVVSVILLAGRDVYADESRTTAAVAGGVVDDDQTKLQQRLRGCNNCHVESNALMSPSHPYLNGQHKGYLIKQLKDFVSGKRDEHVMVIMVDGLSDDQIEKLSAIFADKKKMPVPASTNHAAIMRGKKAYFEKRAIGNMQYSCDGCHGDKAQGDGAKNIPSLTGQKTSYLQMALFHFKHQLRANDPDAVMRKIASTLTDSEILALTEYLTTIK